MTVMPLKFTRSPYEDHSYSAQVSFEGVMYTRPGDGFIGISFSTSPDGRHRSHFAAGIDPKKFEELARLMVEADAQAAIRAFGAAMLDVQIQKQEADPSETVAA